MPMQLTNGSISYDRGSCGVGVEVGMDFKSASALAICCQQIIMIGFIKNGGIVRTETITSISKLCLLYNTSKWIHAVCSCLMPQKLYLIIFKQNVQH